jgi:hypothetical protein
MEYCQYDYSAPGANKYFCDITGSYFKTAKDCFDNCVFKINGVSVHLSLVDMTFLFGLWAILLSVAFFVAFHLSHD